METNIDKECSAMGAMFQQIITDMKVGAPLWEDFLSKASKLHTALKSTLSVIAAYLDAFQKIADAATSAKGATKDIGTVLTRICLRHKAVEARLKTFTSALMECLVLPLQDKLEEWKKFVINLDKEHSKEYKKVKADIKKRSAEAQRWQKKAKKIRSGLGSSGGVGSTIGGLSVSNDSRNFSPASQEILRAADAAQLDLNTRLALLQETEKQALCSALVEERSRFCLFVACLKPVMSEEMAMMTELSHLEEIIAQLDKHTADPFSLPSATEQMIADLKGSTDHGTWHLQTPPSSPSSLGSRKSSMCSLGSIHSSSSGSVASHSQGPLHSPSHVINHGHPVQHIRHRSLSQVAHGAGGVGVRLSSVSSQDSGFTSQDTLVLRPTSSPPSVQLAQEVSCLSEHTSSGECSSNASSSSTPMSPYPPGGLPNAMATWPNLQETIQYDRSANSMVNERPHTISTAYEKGHQRPALSVYTFQPFEHSQLPPPISGGADKIDRNNTPSGTESPEYETLKRGRVDLKVNVTAGSSQESLTGIRPPLPQRCSSLERPNVPLKSKDKDNKKATATVSTAASAVQQDHAPTVPDFHQAAPDMIVPQPVYMNASELRAASGQVADPEGSNGIYSSLGSSCFGLEGHFYDDGQACSCHSCSRDWRPPHHQHPHISSRPVLRRPASFSADPSTMASMEWGHRGSVSRMSHASTIKRTSVASFATLHEVAVDENHLALSDITPTAEVPSSSLIGGSSSVEDVDLATLPPPPDFLLDAQPDGEDAGGKSSATDKTIIAERSLSVAEAVKTLNEIRHQPASPGVVRRVQSMRLASDSAGTGVGAGSVGTELIDQHFRLKSGAHGTLPKGPGTLPKGRRMVEQDRTAHIGPHHHHNMRTLHHPLHHQQHNSPSPNSSRVLVAKAANNNHHAKTLPKVLPSQRPSHHTGYPGLLADAQQHFHYPDQQTQHFQLQQQDIPVGMDEVELRRKGSPQLSSTPQTQGDSQRVVSGLLSRPSFVNALNAKLAQHCDSSVPAGSRESELSKALRIRQMMAEQSVPDPAVCHESLMDQIRRGTSLRRARSTNDRSSPKL